MAEPTTPKRVRRPRRNFERELRELEAYCKAHLEVLSERSGPEREDGYLKGKAVAFQQVIVKMESYNGK